MSQSADFAKNRMKQDQYNILSGQNVFSDDDEIKRFFEKEGFKIEKYPHSKIFDDLTSVKNLGLESIQPEFYELFIRTKKRERGFCLAIFMVVSWLQLLL